jgi:hypothetical protein
LQLHISFDIFDTLVHRTVYKPTSVFALIERQLQTHDLTKTYPFLGKVFASTRIEAEKTARKSLFAPDKKAPSEQSGTITYSFDD